MGKYKVSFFSLGGLGEIGSNCYVYNAYNSNENSAIMVDLGMGFNEKQNNSVDTMFPDITMLENDNIKIEALLITHGHEDHIGSIGHLFEYIKCPIYATAWTADLILEKLKEFRLDKVVKMIIVEPNKLYDIGKFQVMWVEIAHSIPDANLLYIKTPEGNIVHSGDFKIHKGDKKTLDKLKKIGKEGVDFFFCDSTNVIEEGFSDEEDSIRKDLKDIIKNAKGVCWITSFSSNLYRLKNICDIAKTLGKRIVLFGRSFDTYVSLGIKHGILDNTVFIKEEEIKKFNRDNLIFMVTGSQGEYRSVLANILIGGGYRQKIEEKDCVVFSSRIIPGNELKVTRYYNILANMNIEYYTADNFNIHVSGHPKREELKIMYNLLSPKWLIPIHGENMHLREHIKYASQFGIDGVYTLNGEVLGLTKKSIDFIGKVATGKLGYEGFRLFSMEEEFLKRRSKMFYEGSVFVSVPIKENKTFGLPTITAVGLLRKQEEEVFYKHTALMVQSYIIATLDKEEMEVEQLSESLRVLVRKYFREKLDKNPIVVVHIG